MSQDTEYSTPFTLPKKTLIIWKFTIPNSIKSSFITSYFIQAPLNLPKWTYSTHVRIRPKSITTAIQQVKQTRSKKESEKEELS